ncbi:hypothetical protein GJ496_003584 [Pomphorhynchus laevis]|nr:hypothetical protein GJ496_003584 [Pomphorhynchus laevis]
MAKEDFGTTQLQLCCTGVPCTGVLCCTGVPCTGVLCCTGVFVVAGFADAVLWICSADASVKYSVVAMLIMSAIIRIVVGFAIFVVKFVVLDVAVISEGEGAVVRATVAGVVVNSAVMFVVGSDLLVVIINIGSSIVVVSVCSALLVVAVVSAIDFGGGSVVVIIVSAAVGFVVNCFFCCCSWICSGLFFLSVLELYSS